MRYPSVFVRDGTAEERQHLQTGLRAAEAGRGRRCQLVLASAYGAGVARIARPRGCSTQPVRTTLHAFNTQGVACLQRASSRPHPTRERVGSAPAQQLQALLHPSPRTFGPPTRRWTVELAAEVRFAPGLTPQRVSREAIRTALGRLGGNWPRAKRWIPRPAPASARKKKPGTA